jgi:enamine deaminase RidA (YjgF/YER057c/UK114 family)
MATHITPERIRAPFSHYSHGVVVEAGARMLFCSGQLGVASDDTVPESPATQARLCFDNIAALLADAGMSPADLVRLNAYVTARTYLVDYMRERDRFIAGIDPPPASTLMIVSGFARAEFKIEVEAIAAAARS